MRGSDLVSDINLRCIWSESSRVEQCDSSQSSEKGSDDARLSRSLDLRAVQSLMFIRAPHILQLGRGTIWIGVVAGTQ